MRRISAVLLACLALGGNPSCLVAANDASPSETTLQRTARTERSDVGVPGAGRIALVFLLTVALGVAAVVALRRMPQKFWRRDGVPGSIQLLDRARASPTMQVYLVQVGQARIMIAEGRNSTGIVVLSTEEQPGMEKS